MRCERRDAVRKERKKDRNLIGRVFQFVCGGVTPPSLLLLLRVIPDEKILSIKTGNCVDHFAICTTKNALLPLRLVVASKLKTIIPSQPLQKRPLILH